MRSIKPVLGAVLASALLLGGGVAVAAPAVRQHGGRAPTTRRRSTSPTRSTARTASTRPAWSGRRSGADGLSVPATAPDGNHRNVRVTFTLPAYDTSGNEHFFTVLADLAPTAFTPDQAGVNAKQIADASPVYVFPTRTGDPLSVGNNRQADMVDMSGGYFSNNPLGLWVHVFVTWTSKAFDTAAGRKALSDLAARNGLALDGTPIIKSKSQMDSLTKDGLVVQTKRAPGATGRYFVCPMIKEPRNGGIAPDAFLATVRRADGTPLPAEQQFVTDFESLRTTGDYPR